MFLKLSVSDRIQVIAIISTLIISVVSIAIAVATLIQTNKIAKESERAYIVFYIERLKHDEFHSLVIRNFGNSAGTLESIEINPRLEWNNRLKGFNATLWYYVNKKYKLNLEIFRRKTLSNKNIHYTFS